MNDMVEIVNILASGSFDREIDLRSLSADFGTGECKYNPGTSPGAYIDVKNVCGIMNIYSTGSYCIMGVANHGDLCHVYNEVVSELEELEISVDITSSAPEIRNIICKGDLDMEVNLTELIIELGVENVEYEPEQSPFVYYWPNEFDCLITIPTNGQIIITGVESTESAQKAANHLHDRIGDLFPQ
jgi:transcription initiation factor TFIID TATA-box-binding protein